VSTDGLLMNEILQTLYTIDHIPSHPSIKEKIQYSVSDLDSHRESSIEELTRLLYYDPSLSIEFLKIANSESFGFKRKISSIRNALQLLDNELIHLIISQHPVIPDLEAYHADTANMFLQLITHSIEVTIIVEYILSEVLDEKLINGDLRQELITASTIHDIGTFFLLIYFPDRIAEILMRNSESEKIHKKRDNTAIPDHSLISSVLCEFWNLPTSIRSWIAFHHYPWSSNESYRWGAEILYLADSISTSFHELYYPDDIYTIDERIIMRRNLIEITEKLGIDITQIAEIRVHSSIQMNELYAELGL
jgi:HD-like signal output (HDOD) protein